MTMYMTNISSHVHRIRPQPTLPPAILLRESYREAGKVRKCTLANLSKWPPVVVEGLRILLKGGTAVADLTTAFDITRSHPHGHVATVLGTLRKLRLDRIGVILVEIISTALIVRGVL